MTGQLIMQLGHEVTGFLECYCVWCKGAYLKDEPLLMWLNTNHVFSHPSSDLVVGQHSYSCGAAMQH